MDSNSSIVTSTLTRKFSQNSPKKEPLSPIHTGKMNDKSDSSDNTSSIPAGYCTTPRLKKANSMKYFGPVEGSMPKLGHILRELYDTEIEYVNSLEKTVHIYLNALMKEKGPNIKTLCYKIFGNIQDILHFHQDIFLPRLEEVYHSAGEVSALLLEHYENFMRLYVKYCLMICESSQLLKSKNLKAFFKSIREEYKDKQSLSGYLIRPVQRITRYELMLDQMINTYHKANVPCWNIEHAYTVIKEVPTLADNAMRLNSILNYKEHFNVKHLRQLRLHNIFIVSDRDKRFTHKKYYVFLMVDRIIFTKICCDLSETELLCTYKSELLIEEDCVSIKCEYVPDKDQRIFVLLKGKKEIYMQAEKIEIKEKWISQIRELVTQEQPVSPALTNSEIPIEPSPPPYDEYWKANEQHQHHHQQQQQQGSNTDEESNEDVDSDLVDMKHYVVVEDFNPDETMNGFIALRKGQIYEHDGRTTRRGFLGGTAMT
ncbi:hypothetical protein LOD99_8852 [Oopsacas minuta]|uniref:DH domain-containing protein n=1 Tax=Oopsacas minuta TaxID=111878 RepID=A0AAV7JE65_9METZ|nr:hypothetical protein LOD99_8852 [Oopsacas minuta]